MLLVYSGRVETEDATRKHFCHYATQVHSHCEKLKKSEIKKKNQCSNIKVPGKF